MYLARVAASKYHGFDDEEHTLRELWGLKDHDPDDEEYQCIL